MSTDELVLFDSHAHLDFGRLAQDADAVLDRAWKAGVGTIVAIGAGRGVEGAYDAVALAAAEPRIYATVGIHPHDADLGVAWQGNPDEPVAADVLANWEARCASALERHGSLALHPRVVAIGEVGLDFHYDRSPRQLQRELFRRYVRLAVQTRLPLVIHAREAEAEVATILEEEGAGKVGGVIHCFTGHEGLARAALGAGFCFGVTGIVTFPGAEDLRRVVAALPLDRLLVETDSPYLAPVPYRGKRNEPAYVARVAERLAELRELTPSRMADITTANARRLFRIEERECRSAGELAYRFGDALYLNVTNRCTLGCVFCLKHAGHDLGGYELGLKTEPSAEEVLAAVESALEAGATSEIVFCGVGEPLLRPELVAVVGKHLRENGHRVRVNTDGLANLVHGRDVAYELVGCVDSLSVSLNAHDAQTYARLCPSVYGEGAFDAACKFIARAVALFDQVSATVVRQPGVDVEAARGLADSLGAGFRVRG